MTMSSFPARIMFAPTILRPSTASTPATSRAISTLFSSMGDAYTIASDGLADRKSPSMLSTMYSDILFVKPTARTPTAMVRIVKTARDLLPQKSAQTFFERLLMTALPAMRHFPFHPCPPSDATPRAWLRTDSAIRRVDRTQGPEPPQGRLQKRA